MRGAVSILAASYPRVLADRVVWLLSSIPNFYAIYVTRNWDLPPGTPPPRL